MKSLYFLYLTIFISLNTIAQNVHVEQVTKTESYSEISSFYSNGKLYFYKNKPFYKANSMYFDLYVIPMDSNKMSNKDIVTLEDLNTKFNDGPICINKNKAYITRNSYTKKELKNGKLEKNTLEILVYNIHNNNKFIFQKKFKYNSPGITIGHIAFSNKTNRLYYSSQQGRDEKKNADLFYVDIDENGELSQPKKLNRRINSNADEMFPYIHNGVLYFSSNVIDKTISTNKQHDIYYIKESDLFSDAKPIKFNNEINSSADEIGITFIDNKKGYFSSNREGNNKQNNFDIYYFELENEVINDSKKEIEDSLLLAQKMTRAKDSIEKYNSLKNDLAKKKLKDKKVEKFENILFDFDSYRIKEKYIPELEKIIDYLKLNPSVQLKINGFTDSRSSDAYNLKLSDKRALSVYKYLTERGVNKNRLETKGYGETQLLYKCPEGKKCTKNQIKENRRVEINLIDV